MFRLPVRLRTVTGLSAGDLARANAYIQGVVNGWHIDRDPDLWFSGSDLFGGSQANWTGTPLETLYRKQIANGLSHRDAVKAAGKELGHLLKAALSVDSRLYDRDRQTRKGRLVWAYRRVSHATGPATATTLEGV